MTRHHPGNQREIFAWGKIKNKVARKLSVIIEE